MSDYVIGSFNIQHLNNTNADDVLTTAVTATKNIKNNLYSEAVIDSTIDAMAMKDMMKGDGLKCTPFCRVQH